MNTESLFDNIAGAYYSFTPTHPQKYIDLILETFKIKINDSIIDLGCGSGDLVLTFAQHSSLVTGIDISKTMIAMARQKDLNRRATWVHESGNKFDFEKEKYNLIFSFESFHLFPNHKQLLPKIANGLRPGGFLCIGWATYEWELPLKNTITEVFERYGTSWGYEWACPTLPFLIGETNSSLSSPQYKSVFIEASTPIIDVVNWLLSISNTAILDETTKIRLFEELLQKFSQIYPSGESFGKSEYTIMYARKPVGSLKNRLSRIKQLLQGSFSK